MEEGNTSDKQHHRSDRPKNQSEPHLFSRIRPALKLLSIQVNPPTVDVWTYKGFVKNKGVTKSDLKTLNAPVKVPEEDKISSERYVFCGNGPKITYLKNCFIRFEDLRDRINGDDGMLGAHNDFPVWSADGKPQEKTSFMKDYGEWTKSQRFRGMSRKCFDLFDASQEA